MKQHRAFFRLFQALVPGVAALAVALPVGACAGSAQDVSAKARSAQVASISRTASVSGSYLAARQAAIERHPVLAVDLLKPILDQESASPDVLQLGHAMMVSAGRLKEAADIAERLVAQGVDSDLIRLTLVLDRVKAGDLLAATGLLKTVENEGLGRVVTPLLHAWLATGSGDIDGALEALEPLSALRGFSLVGDLHQALILDLAGRTQEAAAAYGRVDAAMPRPSVRVVEVLISFYERNGQPADAEAIYQRYLELRPETLFHRDKGDIKAVPRPVATYDQGIAEALFHIAGILQERSAPNGALLYGQMAVDLRPDFDSARMLVAETLDALQRFEDANEFYRSIPAGSDFSWSARIRSAENLQGLGRVEDALALLRDMGEERQDRTDALSRLGSILRAEERYDEAVSVYDEILRRVGTVEPRHWPLLYARGMALERAKQWPRAEADLLRALELSPDQPLVLNYLGYSWADQGIRIEEALSMIKRAVTQRPDDGFIVDSLGWALHRIGRFEDAVIELERAVELTPQDPVINDHLGDAYWSVGRYYEARYQWQRALTLAPSPDVAASLKVKLERVPPRPKRGKKLSEAALAR